MIMMRKHRMYPQAKHLKMLSQEGKLTADKIEEIMGEQKPNQVEKFKLNKERIQKHKITK